MLFKRPIRKPILGLFLVSLGGLLLHLRIHPPDKSLYNVVPLAFGAVTTFLLPLLFNYRRTVAWAYVINLAAVVVGTVTMAHFSWTHWQGPITPLRLLLESTLADILILAAKLPLGHAILRHFRPVGGEGEGRP